MMGGAGMMQYAKQLQEKNRALQEHLRDRRERLYKTRFRKIRKKFSYKAYDENYKKVLQAQLKKEKLARKIISILHWASFCGYHFTLILTGFLIILLVNPSVGFCLTRLAKWARMVTIMVITMRAALPMTGRKFKGIGYV